MFCQFINNHNFNYIAMIFLALILYIFTSYQHNLNIPMNLLLNLELGQFFPF